MCAEKIEGIMDNEIATLRGKLLDAENVACRLEDINNLFIPFANENCPEGTVVAGLFQEQIDTLHSIVKF